MKKITKLIFVFTVFSAVNLLSQLSIEVGKQPSQIYFDQYQNGFHVICSGFDDGFDGIMEFPEEENPSLWFLSNQNGEWNAEKKIEFDFASFKFPLRPAIMWDEEESILYIPQNNVVKSFSLSTFEMIDDELIKLDVRGIATSGISHLFLTINDFISTSELRVYSLSTGQTLQTLQAETNVQMSVQYITSENKTGIAILNEGDWGESNSTVQIGEIVHMGNFDLTSIDIGDMGNYIYYNVNYPDLLFVTVNGSDKLVIIDLIKKEITHEIELDYLTSPRECIVFDDKLYITTYSETLLAYDLNTYELLSTTTTESFSEGLALGNNYIAVANISNSDYSPNNTIQLFPTNMTSIEELSIIRTDVFIFPNPSNNLINIDLPESIIIQKVEIYDLSGNKKLIHYDNQKIVDISNLNQGVYFIKIETNDSIFIQKFEVIK